MDLPHHSAARASSATTPGKAIPADYTGNTGVWGQISVDEQLGLAYLPVELPTGDYYGGHRPGNGLFGESIVAVDLKTGQRKWHYQLVHHGIWDMDIPCAPILVDITVNGRAVKAVAQPTKQAFLYVFDRTTGQPIWPIEEKPVEQSTVPGEKTSPTQPFPTKPPAYDRQGFSLDDLIDFTPELKAQAREIVSHYQIGPVFTPPVLSKAEGPFGTLALATASGGTNWTGGSVDPETGIAYIPSQRALTNLALVPSDPKTNDFRFVQGTVSEGVRAATGAGGDGAAEPGRANPGRLSVQNLPLFKPPYGQISAIDLNKGEILWQIPNGETPDVIRNHPALKGISDSTHRTGRYRRRHGHQDTGHRRRDRHHHHARWQKGRVSARLRQEDRKGCGRGRHACRTNRIADDLHAKRQAVHRSGGRRRRLSSRVSGLQAAELNSYQAIVA